MVPVSKLLNLPIGSYLMVRLDYVIICGNNELEAKVLRLIEMYMDDERKRLYQAQLNDPKNDLTPDVVVEITRDVWVPISHRLFMNDLYGTVKSENTLKQAIKFLLGKKYIRVSDPPTKQYEAPKYQINIDVVQGELDKLAKLGKPGYQNLIPSNSDTINKRPHQNLIPSGYQEMTPSGGVRVSKIDTNSIKDYGNKKDTVEEESLAPTSLSETDSHSHADYTKLPARVTPIPFAEQAKAITDRRQTDPALPVVKPKRPKSEKPSEPEIAPEAVRIMDDWDSVLKKPVPRTQGHIDAAILLIPCNPTREELDAVRKWLFTTDRPEKPWYRKIGVHLPDISKNFEKWRSLQEMPSEQQNGKSTGPELGDCGYPKLHPRKPVYPDTNKQEPGKGPRYA